MTRKSRRKRDSSSDTAAVGDANGSSSNPVPTRHGDDGPTNQIDQGTDIADMPVGFTLQVDVIVRPTQNPYAIKEQNGETVGRGKRPPDMMEPRTHIHAGDGFQVAYSSSCVVKLHHSRLYWSCILIYSVVYESRSFGCRT